MVHGLENVMCRLFIKFSKMNYIFKFHHQINLVDAELKLFFYPNLT